MIDTILYSPDLNKLAILFITKHPTSRQLIPTKNKGYYYNATTYLGVRQKDTISLSWLGPNFSNSTNRKELSKEIRQACFKTFVSKDTSAQFAQKFHGTKANLKKGDVIEPGFNSNYGKRKKASYVYLTATLDAAIWGAELSLGEGPGRIYIVEPTGPIEDDPNLTDKKFPGNPTKSYRSGNPLRVSGEVTNWQGHSPEQLKAMKEHLERLKQLGIEAIGD